MAKKPVKKSAPKKAVKKASSAKKSPAKKAPAKKTAKKAISEKELLQKEVNRIVNSERKKKVSGKKGGKSLGKQQSASVLDAVVDGMLDKKAKNIMLIDLRELENRVCDYFVICDADSTTHVDAIADSVEDVVKKKTNEKPYHTEGHQNSEWIIIDYIDVVAHVFLREKREYYNLEALWADGEVKQIN